MEEVFDYLEEEGDGLLHLEGKGVKPDTDDEESLGEVLDREQGRKQRLPSATMGGYSHFVHLGIISDDPSYSEMPEPYQTYRIDRIFRISKMQLASHSKRSS